MLVNLVSGLIIPDTLEMLLTGTPVQNNLSELYSLLHFIHQSAFPLTDLEAFVQRHKGDAEMESLRETLGKYMLRRTKSLVCSDLPEKTEVILYHGISSLQRDLYKAILTKNRAVFDDAESGTSRQSLLNTMMQLRKCVNHPYLFQGVEPEPFTEGEHLVESSGKLAVLDRLLAFLRPLGHRVLLFSQMTNVLDILQDYLTFRDISSNSGIEGYSYERLDGSVRCEERFAAVKRFNNKESNDGNFVFLLSTRAGGLGLTLTAADTVIFYDSDFNPQNDLQAAARSHRIGQDRLFLLLRPVKVIRLVGKHTVEEVILSRASLKLNLTKAVMADSDTEPESKLTAAEVTELLTRGLGNLEKADETPSLDLLSILGPSKDNKWLPISTESSESNAEKVGSSSEEQSIYTFEGEDYREAAKERDRAALKAMLSQADVPVEPGRRGKPVARFAIPEAKPRVPLTPAQLEERRVKREAAAAKRKEKAAAEAAEKEEERVARRAAKWEASGYNSLALPDCPPDDPDALAEDEEEPTQPIFLKGDVSHPSLRPEHAKGDAIILHVVDDSGSWASGGVFGALARRSLEVPRAYGEAGKMRDLSPGTVHLVPADDVESRHPDGRDYVALAVAQSRKHRGSIDQAELVSALRKVAAYVEGHPGTTVHLPRIGYGLPHVNWYGVERSVRRYLCGAGVPTYIYYFPKKRQHQPASSSDDEAKRRRQDD